MGDSLHDGRVAGEDTGRAGAESKGIVDLLALRRDHRTERGPFRRCDLFELVLIQIKGGSAAWPTPVDIGRLQAVQRRYHEA
jgi:hypothetical protein